MAFDPGLAQRVRECLRDEIGCSEKAMFGGLAFLVDGKMFVGVERDRLMARIGPDGYAQALALPYVREMDFTGKPLKGYVYVALPGLLSDLALQTWVRRSLDHVRALPPAKRKVPKAARPQG